MPNLNKIYLYRMTHIENIPHILKNGITHYTSTNANPNYAPIGDGSLISTRNNFILNNGKSLGDYIPFYFGVKTPMLYVIQNGFNMVASTPTENIVYCVTSMQKIIDLNLDFVFTDGHAVEKITTQYTISDIKNIEILLDWNAIKPNQWKDDKDLDKKRRKQAEFLVLGDIDEIAILGFITYNEKSKDALIGFGANSEKVLVKPEFYF